MLSSNGQEYWVLAVVVFYIARVMLFFSWLDEVRATCVPLSFHLEYSEDGYDLSFGLLLIGDGGGDMGLGMGKVISCGWLELGTTWGDDLDGYNVSDGLIVIPWLGRQCR